MLIIHKMFVFLFFFCSQFDGDNMYMNDNNQEFRSPSQVSRPDHQLILKFEKTGSTLWSNAILSVAAASAKLKHLNV